MSAVFEPRGAGDDRNSCRYPPRLCVPAPQGQIGSSGRPERGKRILKGTSEHTSGHNRQAPQPLRKNTGGFAKVGNHCIDLAAVAMSFFKNLFAKKREEQMQRRAERSRERADITASKTSDQTEQIKEASDRIVNMLDELKKRQGNG